MDYQKTYDNLIRTRKERVPVTGVYYERHHIIMTSMGGKNTPDNLVKFCSSSCASKYRYKKNLIL